MELKLQYILHFLGSNISNNSLVQRNSDTCKSSIVSSRTDTRGKTTNAQREKHILKAIYNITTALCLNCDASLYIL